MQVRSFLLNAKRNRLRNGLTILMREDHTVPVVTTMMWYRVGSRFEKPGQTGISHLLEHMLFKGTDRYGKGEIDYITARSGGSNNAFTSHDYTTYLFSFSSQRWRPALEMEADRMRNNHFDLVEIELEKHVVIEEMRMERDNPWGALQEAVYSSAMGKHPYGFPVMGQYEDLVRIGPDQIIDYYRRFYTPNNAVLVVVGDFYSGQDLERIQTLFESISSTEVPQLATLGESRPQERTRVHLNRPTKVTRIIIAFPAPSVRQSAHYAMQLLDNLLSEGKLSRFYQRLIERERVASLATTEFTETFDPSLFLVRLELLEGVQPEEAEAIVFDEIAQLHQTLLPLNELKRAKNQCITAFLSSLETTGDQAFQLGLMEVFDRFEYWNTYQERIELLTPEKVRTVAAQYLSPDHATIGLLSDEKTHLSSL